MPRKVTSIRLGEDEIALIRAWGAYLQEQTGVAGSTSSVLRMLLKRARPPDSPGETQARVRRAWSTMFGEIKETGR